MKSNLTVRLVKKNGKLAYRLGAEEDIFNSFVGNLAENTKLEVFISTDSDDGTLAQLAKLHANIKEISESTGETAETIKLWLKKRLGMVITTNDEYYIKSFGDCSKSELSRAIQESISLGEGLGISLY